MSEKPSIPSAAGHRAIFVVGAGRSGTSAMTRALLALGVELGSDLKRPTDKNPTGFFEDRELLGLAKQARKQLGLRTESVALIETPQFANAALDSVREQVVASIRERFGDIRLWGFKYAQTLRMLPFWEAVFYQAELDVSYLVALRNPLSVAQSRAKLDPLRGIQEKSDLEWLVNVVPWFRRLSRRPFVVVDYDSLMADPAAQLERIAGTLDIPLTGKARDGIQEYAESFLDSDRRHSHFDDAELDRASRLNPLTRDAYRLLRQLASDRVAPDSVDFWGNWTGIEQALAAMAPALRHIDYLEAEVRRQQGKRLSSTWRRLRRALPQKHG